MTISDDDMHELLAALSRANAHGDRGRRKATFDETRARARLEEVAVQLRDYEHLAPRYADFARHVRDAAAAFADGLNDGSDEARTASERLAELGAWADHMDPGRSLLRRLTRAAYFIYFDLADAEPRASFYPAEESSGGPFIDFVVALSAALGLGEWTPDGVRSALKVVRAEAATNLGHQLDLLQPPPDPAASSAEVFGDTVGRLSD